MAEARDSIPISNVTFDRVSMAEAVVRVLEMARRHDHPRHVCTANLDHLAMLEQDGEFRSAYTDADLVLADGMPVVWLSRLAAKKPLPERVPGSDLFWELARASALTGVRLFYLGGSPGSAERAAAAVRERYPAVRVCGTYCPPFEEFGTEAEQDRIAAIVHAAEPDILLVGLGAPKQEKWKI